MLKERSLKSNPACMDDLEKRKCARKHFRGNGGAGTTQMRIEIPLSASAV